ncbi:hypothetical protein NQ315_010284 [Exocentrus adspersus]|uniref:Tr-type G domain-containing protein n=1 Tax=Exocentrus adspersus TaxID=1586481 RepID=A0AAV8WBN3_9CUCU|nr:hypothetical protein NQ315_010284 [Exocentrus adspersus]
MESLKPTFEELDFCMRDPKCIRNVCILAHVDHGKTTVSDLLLATNHLVSKRMAGFLRYLDDRPDEQERGITMKSSAVSLLNLIHDEEDGKNKKILLNVIDTPGHIDFSSEVGVALRVCDVLNKFDRVIVELQKDIEEIFQCILRVIEDCNAIIAELYQYEYLDNDADIENTGLLFSPDTGNVIFASAIDAWGFTTKQIARLFVDLVKNETVQSLNTKMWDFDCYIDSKKEIKTGAIDKKKTNLFIQLCLKTIYQIYETIAIRMEKDRTSVILDRLKIKNVTKDMTHNDPKVQIRAILRAWMPLSSTILLQCLKIIPAPCHMDKRKIEYLLNLNRFCENEYLNNCIESVIPYFLKSSIEDTAPTIAYVSKMFCVNKNNLSQNKPKVFVPKPRDSITSEPTLTTSTVEKPKQDEKEEMEEPKYVDDKIVLIALTRVFTGTLRVNQVVYVMTNSYLPDVSIIDDNAEDYLKDNKNVVKVVIKELYMLFGRELMLVDSIPAGNFCGIGGLEAYVIRTATLASTLNIVPITERLVTNPVVRHAIEPENPKELPILRQGLKLLMQSDSCVEIMMQKTGELVILTAGDVHLQKCIEDLKSKFAMINFHVSSPMVSLRETVVNELSEADGIVELDTTQFILSVKCVSLPESISNVVKNNYNLLRTVEEHQHKSFVDIAKQCIDNSENNRYDIEKVFKSELIKRGISHVKELLRSAFESAGDCWKSLHSNIWSVGRRNDCINLLINNTQSYSRNIFLELTGYDRRALFDHCIVKAFDVLCEAGPLCEELLTNCAFIITKFDLKDDIQPQNISPQVTSVLESAIRDSLKKAFEKQEQRLVEPMYITDIQVNTNILGEYLFIF